VDAASGSVGVKTPLSKQATRRQAGKRVAHRAQCGQRLRLVQRAARSASSPSSCSIELSIRTASRKPLAAVDDPVPDRVGHRSNPAFSAASSAPGSIADPRRVELLLGQRYVRRRPAATA